jgi:hypothetical protein
VIKGLMPPRFGMVTINPKLRLGSFAQVRVSLTAKGIYPVRDGIPHGLVVTSTRQR